MVDSSCKSVSAVNKNWITNFNFDFKFAKQSTISNIIYVGKGRKSQRSYEST